jgi:type IV pilus biogenesis protein CpaD/CtpE
MKRQLPLLLAALAAASLTGGCASTPQSATEALTSDILNGSSQNPTCAYGEIPRCMTTGSRISGLKQQASCECLVRELAIRAQ